MSVHRLARKQQEEDAIHGRGVALIYHFNTLADAELVLDRLETMGGLGHCIGHLWDEEEMVGWVAAHLDTGDMVSTEAHISRNTAIEDGFQAMDKDADACVEVYALLPEAYMSGPGCETGEGV